MPRLSIARISRATLRTAGRCTGSSRPFEARRRKRRRPRSRSVTARPGRPRTSRSKRPASEVGRVTERPRLFTFDIFGTVIDWRTGLLEAIRAKGGKAGDAEFQALIDQQAEAEHGPHRPYAEIVAQSLVNVLGMSRARARAIGEGAGEWPLFPDARDGIRRLQRIAPCVAMTNSDAHQGIAVQRQLGFRLSGWIC